MIENDAEILDPHAEGVDSDTVQQTAFGLRVRPLWQWMVVISSFRVLTWHCNATDAVPVRAAQVQQ